jgi:hypothetical protein
MKLDLEQNPDCSSMFCSSDKLEIVPILACGIVGPFKWMDPEL